MSAQVTTWAKIKSLRREIALRKAVYPRRVAAKQMLQSTADYELAVMEAILDDYQHGASLLFRQEADGD